MRLLALINNKITKVTKMKSKENIQKKVLGKICKLKHNLFGNIKISYDFNNVKYELLLLTSDCADNKELMQLIGRWRKENEIWFPSQFNVTTERTTKWFKDKVTNAPDKLLFMIKAGDDYIGHVGLFRFDFEANTCEIDNIIRGEPAYPGIMYDAIKNMMDWGRNMLGLKNYSLKTFSYNEKAIKLYKRLGFKAITKIPLIQTEGKDGLEWIDAPEGYAKKINRYNLIMKYERKNYYLHTNQKQV